MGTTGSPSDARTVFDRLDEPRTPLTTAEVAEKLECAEGIAQQKLASLAERGELQTRKIGDQHHVWWHSERSTGSTERRVELEEFGAFVDAVEDYAIFMLEPDGTVASWNEGAERIKGYSEEEIVGEHISTFYTDEDIDAGMPEHNLETAAAEGRVEDEGWRVRKDGSQFWADVIITAIRDDHGDLRGFTKVTRDKTQQREYEEQLRQERDLTERTLETVPVSICVINSDGEFVRANQRLLDRLGVDELDLREYSVASWDLYDADGDPIPIENWPWTQVRETSEPVYDFKCRVALPHRGTRWLSINAAPLEEIGDENDRVVVSIDDITEQQEREQELRREYDLTEKLLRTAPIAIAVQDAEGNTLLANQRAQDALGLSEQEFIEEPENADEWQTYDENGDPLADSETPTARALATGEPVYDREIIFDPPNGERLHFTVNSAPVFGSDGTIERIITAGEDVTELKEHERALEQRKEELETELSEILGRISDAFYALDDEWRFTHLNERAAAVMQHPMNELRGEKVWEMFPDSTDGIFWEEFHRAMETQEAVSFEFHAGELGRWLEFNAYPSESGLSIYFTDITERKEYERKLEESNERLEQFAYAASHDLQEPLRMVSSYLQLIEKRYEHELDEDGREFIEYAVDGADRMRRMVDALLEYSRVETSGEPLEPVRLDGIVEDALENLTVQIEERDADVTVDPLPRVQGDADQLRQVFQNLLSNAITYSEGSPEVHVSAERDDDRWIVSVRDEGIGIEPAHQEKIFEVFQRLTTDTARPGTGIGLALCQRIVERHGGEIWVDSEPGGGSTFSFTVPTVDEGEQ